MSDQDHSLTVVVTRIIKPGCEESFEVAMREFIAIAWTFPGHLGMQMLRPAEARADGEYTIIARFESLEARRAFTSSDIYCEWMERLGAHSLGAPVVRELNGIEGLFALAGQAGSPSKWRMALTVWVGVYILSQSSYELLGRWVGDWPRAAQAVPVTTIVVGLLTWVVLPGLTRALRGWYFPQPRTR